MRVRAELGTVWAGIDVGKTHHWVCVVDTDGTTVLSVKIGNDQNEIDAVIATVTALAERVEWALDIIGAPSALLLALLNQAGQQVRYASGRVVAAMSAAYTGEGKTDAKDAHVIAETVRLRRDLTVVDHATDLARNLGLLTAHRADLVADRVRMINRLRDLMTSVFPALEREFDYSSCKGALVLLTGYAAPDRLRRIGEARLAGWLRGRRVRGYAQLAARAVAAARTQQVTLPGQDIAAKILSDIAGSVLALDERLKDLDAQIAVTFEAHPQAAIIQSMPGFGPFLGASLLATAGDLRAFPTAGHLAAAAGLVPVPNDSGRRTGNLHKPRRYSRPLQHVFYLSAQTSMIRPGPNRDYYLKKRQHGRTHNQAVIALARRRIDVLWALLSDNRLYTEQPPPRTAQTA
jgi:transposase